MMTDAHPLSRHRTLEEWESWVDKAIAEARDRGEFDNLPGRGKPLQLDDAPFADGREIGFGILKNAGMAPYWVELNKEISSATDALDRLRGQAANVASELRSPRPTVTTGGEQTPQRKWWQLFRYVEPSTHESRERLDQQNRLELERLRRDYLAQTEALNKKIAHYNASIPRELWQLERTVRSLADAEREFDAACS
jgi:hypothetical protein